MLFLDFLLLLSILQRL